ncbi:MAG: bifunctional DNA-formamidopyrimidine glycosylase/DNA-(apurinic or apyrimidinic site) lyase [Actinomycetota bacterium]
MVDVPELPEVESVRRQLLPRLVGRRIRVVEAVPQARFSGLSRAAGTTITDLRRRGKYLLADLASDRGDLELVAHLGMTGAFRFRDEEGWEPDAYVRATVVLDDAVLDFRDVRRFGRLSVVDAGDHGAIATLSALGPEPLSSAFTPEGLHAALAASRQPVKAQLLSQRPVAGVGNIYADEALWAARINPRSRRVGPQRAARLWAALREVLAAAIEREGTTFRDYQMVNGQSGRYATHLAAYGQAGRPCRRCATTLRAVTVAGRGTTYCPSCQRQ